jgi:hypothetical protein
MKEAIDAYRSVTVAEEFKTLERMRSDARRNEASALRNAERKGKERSDAKWQVVIADRDAALANRDAEIERLRTMLENRQPSG